MSQKFHMGDLVHVAKDLGQSMSHFTNDIDAIVIGSYKDEYGGDNTKSYTLHLKGYGRCSWYYEHQLILLEKNRCDLLESWEKELKDDEEQKSNLDWIFANGNEVVEKGYGASVQTLANCLGLSNLWGSHGEGFVYFENALWTIAIAEPFLKNADKDGWLVFCEKIKEKK